MSRILKSSLSAAGALALLVGGAAAASAHVSVTPDKTDAKSYALLTFGVPHGCDGSATTKITIDLPEDLNDATPTVNPNWTITKVAEKLPEPKKLDTGNSITSRTKSIVYTAKTPLDPHERDALVLSVQVPNTPEKTQYFPTLQTCEKGSTNWNEIPKDGQDPETLKAPAPAFVVTAASAGSGHGGHGAAAPSSSASADASDHGTHAEAASSTSGSGADVRSWFGLGAGVIGLLLGAFALFRTTRKGQ